MILQVTRAFKYGQKEHLWKRASLRSPKFTNLGFSHLLFPVFWNAWWLTKGEMPIHNLILKGKSWNSYHWRKEKKRIREISRRNCVPKHTLGPFCSYKLHNKQLFTKKCLKLNEKSCGHYLVGYTLGLYVSQSMLCDKTEIFSLCIGNTVTSLIVIKRGFFPLMGNSKYPKLSALLYLS